MRVLYHPRCCTSRSIIALTILGLGLALVANLFASDHFRGATYSLPPSTLVTWNCSHCLQSLQYMFKLLDIHGHGYLDPFTLNYFFRVSSTSYTGKYRNVVADRQTLYLLLGGIKVLLALSATFRLHLDCSDLVLNVNW